MFILKDFLYLKKKEDSSDFKKAFSSFLSSVQVDLQIAEAADKDRCTLCSACSSIELSLMNLKVASFTSFFVNEPLSGVCFWVPKKSNQSSSLKFSVISTWYPQDSAREVIEF